MGRPGGLLRIVRIVRAAEPTSSIANALVLVTYQLCTLLRASSIHTSNRYFARFRLCVSRRVHDAGCP